MKNNFKESIVTLGLIVIAVLLLNPFHFWMPDMMVMSMLAIALVLFGVFASFILRKKSIDERDNQPCKVCFTCCFVSYILETY